MIRTTPPQPVPASAPRLGFTLIELVAVVLILGILAAVAAPRFADSVAYHRAEAAAKRVSSDLQSARRNSRLTSTSRTVSFDADADTYTLAGIGHPDHPGAAWTVDLAGTGYSAALVSADFDGDDEVTFDRFGRPDSGGTVVLQSGGNQKTIAVEAVTGRVTIQ